MGKLNLGNSTETIQLILREKFKYSQDMYSMFSAFLGQVYRRRSIKGETQRLRNSNSSNVFKNFISYLKKIIPLIYVSNTQIH